MKFIDLSVQQEAIREELNLRLSEVLAHGQYIMGPEVAELEGILREFVGVRHCVTVASGTDALLISLMTLGVGPGDEVITTPFTFISTVEVIVLLGATPVFVDVERDTGLMDSRLIEAKITQNTKAIMPVSLYGQVPNMEAINRVAKKYFDIPVIEDAAQSFGATISGKKSCGLSTIGCTSFFPSKPLGCYGDGGAIFTNSDHIAEKARAIRVHGQKNRYVHDFIGLGGRMDTIQCAILLAKWPRFTWEIQRRQAVGKHYTKHLEPLQQQGVLELIRVDEGRTSVFGQYTVRIQSREEIRNLLNQSGIPTAVHYPNPINQQPAYKKFCKAMDTPNAELLSREVLSLPMGPDLNAIEQEHVIAELIKACEFFETRQCNRKAA